MNPKLSKEVIDALHTTNPDTLVQAVDPTTNKVYLIVDQELPAETVRALKRQQDIHAIQQGIDQMEAGLGMPLEEARQIGREELIARFKEASVDTRKRFI